MELQAKGIRCSIIVVLAPIFSTLRSIVIPTSTAALHLGCTFQFIRSPLSTKRGPIIMLILPWNLKNEIVAQMRHVGAWGCKFVVPIPKVEVIDPREFMS